MEVILVIKVLGKKLLVEKIVEEEKNTTSSGIWIAPTNVSKLQAAIVKTKGDEVSEKIKIGTKIYFNSKFSGTPFDDELLLLEENQIMAYED